MNFEKEHQPIGRLQHKVKSALSLVLKSSLYIYCERQHAEAMTLLCAVLAAASTVTCLQVMFIIMSQ